METPIVLKVGGALLESAGASEQFFNGLKSLQRAQPNYKPILVHGGGAQVQQQLAALGFQSEKRNGVRITPESHMPHVTGVLAGGVNKQLVAHAMHAGLNAIGISIVDGGLVRSKITQPELGMVGDVTHANPKLLHDLLAANWLPIVASIGIDDKDSLVNVNADHAAAALATALKCPLVLLSDVNAVLDDDKQRIATITPASMRALIEQHTIKDGMQVKVESAMATAKATFQPVTIAGWQDNIHAIIKGDNGTQIMAQKGQL